MVVEDVDITLENLLNLALGTPEIGAVNFNFLHEVISGILKHLDISKKVARLTNEVSTRSELPRSPHHDPSSNMASIHRVDTTSIESIPEVPEITSITKKQSADEVVSEKSSNRNSRTKSPVHSTNNESESLTVKSVKKNEKAPEEIKRSSFEKKASEEIKRSSLEKKALEEIKRSSLEKKAPEEIKRSSGEKKTPKQSLAQIRKSSLLSASNLPPIQSVIQDMAIVQRMDRRDSKTPASDMWHILNINRRVEASEAAIQGMTNLIDNIHADLEELRVNGDQPPFTGGDVTGDVTDSAPQNGNQDVTVNVSMKLKCFSDKLRDIEVKMSELAKKEDLSKFCTDADLKKIVEDQFENIAPAFEEGVVQLKSRQSSPSDSSQSELDKLDSKCYERTSTGSRSKIAFTEVSNKILFLEQEIHKACEQIKNLELQMAKKAEVSTIEDKAEKSDVERSLMSINKESKDLALQLTKVQKNYQTSVEDISALTSQSNEMQSQQTSLSKAVYKLERNLEDMTDNFHRKQSEIMKVQPKHNTIDEVVVTKLRGSIFELQERQSDFQNQFDWIEQDTKNKDKKLKHILTEIDVLKEIKVDQEELHKLLEGKADLNILDGKADLNQFDAFVSEMERSVQAIAQKIDFTECSTKQTASDLEQHINSKMDKNEAQQIRSYIDSRFKTYKPKVTQIKQVEEGAAGTRKKLVPNCNCISCDRPIDVPTTHAGAVLPYYHPFPGMKGIRPVTTFELQTIRQHMQQNWLQGNKERIDMSHARGKLQNELLQLCGVRDLDELTLQTNRACGGTHTLVEQHRRNPGRPFIFCREEQADFQMGEKQLFETDVLGRDGHIYKGRMQTPNLTPLPAKHSKEMNVAYQTTNQLTAYPSVQNSGSIVDSTPTTTLPKLQTVE